MHPIQVKLLELSKSQNLAKLSLRELAELTGLPKGSPQKIKHHLLQLQKKGFLVMDRAKGTMERAGDKPGLVKGLLKNASKLFSIPVIGTANCGPAQIFAEPNFQGFLKVSGKLIKRSRPDGLFAVKADGASMNRAIIDGKNIEDGDYVIINSEDRTPDSNNVVLVIIENKATIKRFIDDRENGQVVLKADSSFDFEPIYLHPEDEFFINGKAVAVVKNV